MTTMTISPREHDEAEAALFEQAAKAERTLESHRDRMHGMAGDRKDYLGRRQYWKMTGAQVLDQLRALMNLHGDAMNLSYGMKPSEAMAREQVLVAELAGLSGRIEEMERVWREHRWQRFFPCQNTDGHIHSSLRGCPSVRWDTAMAWYPSLSGKTVEDAVAELGPALCSICFPLAPVEHKAMTLGQVEQERTRAERDAAKAEREAKKAAKNLTEDEQFRVPRGQFGELITTVAAAIQLLRQEREFFYYGGYGPHCDHAAYAQAAEMAKTVLLAREAAHPGWGATQEFIDKVITTADRKHKKEAGL